MNAALVTGGGGFLGSAVVRQLVGRGVRVRSLARQRYPALDALGVEQVQGDVADAAAVTAAADGCDAVFHVAAKAGVWGRADDYHRANVLGTCNVIAACRARGVRRLVFTSSPSVVFGTSAIEGGDESLPYPTRHLADYPRTKAVAEREVLAANGPYLATVALRPHLVWGPGDNHLLPRLLTRARSGRLFRVGDGRNRADVTYVDNAAAAHMLAADRLAPGSPVAGKAYFLSQGEPVEVWPFIDRLLAIVGQPPVTRSIPAGAAYAAGAVLEFVYGVLRREDEPRMTRFLAKQLAVSHWFDITAARRDLGYEPAVSTEEGLRRLAESLQRV
jgi:nucleoside-diphosphate-sugar epimerase